MAEQDPLLSDDPIIPLELELDQIYEFISYPGGFCCGRCPVVMQLPWRCVQCCAGCSVLGLLYAPVLLFLWALSCCHGCCCDSCCPTIIGDPPPNQYTRTPSAGLKCFSSHSRKFFGCLMLRVLGVSNDERGCCWRCCHHFICCIAGMDTLINQTSAEYVMEMRNNFGDNFPMYGGMAVCNYEEGVEIIVGKDLYRTDAIFLGQESNSVMSELAQAGSLGMSTNDPQFENHRKVVAAAFDGGWARARLLGHTSASNEAAQPIRTQINSIMDKYIANESDWFKMTCSIIFYMLTGGELSDDEIETVNKADVFTFFGNQFHFLAGGYFLLYRVADAVQTINTAVVRYPEVANRVIAVAREEGIPATVALRGFAAAVLTAGGVGVRSYVTRVQKLIAMDEGTYGPLFDEYPIGFVKEVARIEPAVTESARRSSNTRKFVSGGRNVEIQVGDLVMAPFSGVQTSVEVTGRLDMGFVRENVTDEEFGEKNFDRMVTFNGIDSVYREENFMFSEKAPACCPGRDLAIPLTAMIVQRIRSAR